MGSLPLASAQLPYRMRRLRGLRTASMAETVDAVMEMLFSAKVPSKYRRRRTLGGLVLARLDKNRAETEIVSVHSPSAGTSTDAKKLVSRSALDGAGAIVTLPRSFFVFLRASGKIWRSAAAKSRVTTVVSLAAFIKTLYPARSCRV